MRAREPGPPPLQEQLVLKVNRIRLRKQANASHRLGLQQEENQHKKGLKQGEWVEAGGQHWVSVMAKNCRVRKGKRLR